MSFKKCWALSTDWFAVAFRRMKRKKGNSESWSTQEEKHFWCEETRRHLVIKQLLQTMVMDQNTPFLKAVN